MPWSCPLLQDLSVRWSLKRDDLCLEGNLLLSRLADARLHLCGASTYRAFGGDLRAADRLNEEMAQQLRRQGKNPYVIPVGGTCPLGTWGYLSAVEELQEQLSPEDPVDHIVVAAGSGGTLAGLALALHLAGGQQQLHGVNIQHEPDVYRKLIASEAMGLGCDEATAGAVAADVQLLPGAGRGYAQSAQRELRCLAEVARSSGVVLDHVYAGKALYHFCEYAKANPDAFRNSHILFWHTGGLFGLYSQAERLQSLPKRVSTFAPTP